ncbi:integral membrane protein [Fusarium beomiforme]|uniref:Integral membrane protein n=1 Tax=Fusarium beomiforme TaxID=44412 RepID=A0A9P5AM19_9HYPO|nr:integral membrane protein [Fusarium beomiforme]
MRSLLPISILTFFSSARASYVNFKDCSTPSSSAYSYDPGSLDVYLDSRHNGTTLSLEVVGKYPTIASCQRSLLDNASVELSLEALGGTTRYNGEIQNATCRTREIKQINTIFYMQYLDVIFKINDPKPLAAYEFVINIDAPDHFSVACLNGFLTPDIGHTFQAISFWIPALTFILVVLAAGWREWYNLVHPLREDDESGQERSSSRSHLTRIADCLAYIQFIFFSSALSIRQPGFLQPVVSSTSWSTLMTRRGIVWRHSQYYGIRDGIHEINGTFGGTSGLEHMTQVMGAPVTMETWTNIATLAVVILVLLYAIIQIGLHLRWTRDWFQQSGRWMIESSSKPHKATIWVALRVYLSYLLLPLTAWTTYQLDSASVRPVYYTLLVIVVVVLLLIGCWWGMSRSPQDMGYLLVDNLLNQSPEKPSRTQDYYAYVTFVLLFARGVIIGGLQRFGTVQLLSLMACEVVQLGFLAWVQAAPGLLSKPVLISGARLCALLLCLGMIPDLWSHTAASALGYGLLAFHALFLVGMFLVPSIYESVQLAIICCTEWKTPHQPARDSSLERPQVYGLRQLSRRPTTRTDLTGQSILDHDRSNSLSSSANSSSDSANRLSRGSEPVSPELLRTYFRSPRPERSVSCLSDRRISSFDSPRSSRCASRSSPRHQQFPSFESPRPPTVYENPNERNSVGSSLSTDSGDIGEQPSAWSAILPSNTQVDYSFRETDLYYHKPREVSFGNADSGDNETGGQSSGWAGKLKFWS